MRNTPLPMFLVARSANFRWSAPSTRRNSSTPSARPGFQPVARVPTMVAAIAVPSLVAPRMVTGAPAAPPAAMVICLVTL